MNRRHRSSATVGRLRTVGFGVSALVLAFTASACSSSGGGKSAASSSTASASVSSSGDPVLNEALGTANVAQFQALYAQAQKEGDTSLVIWDASQTTNAPLYAAFMKRFPSITIQAQQVNAGDMLTKLNAEQAAGKRTADIAATGSTAMLQGAASNNFASYSPFTATSQKGDPVQAGPNDDFRQYITSPKSIIYNTNTVKGSDIPKGFADLTGPQWKGNKIAIRDPTVPGGGNELFSEMVNDGRFSYDYFQKLADQGLKLVTTGTDLANTVATGQAAIGIPGDYDIYLAQKAKGAPLGFVWPAQGGSELSDLYIGVVNQAPHLAAAQLYESWVFSPEAVKTINTLGAYSPSPQVPENAPPGLTPFKQLDYFKQYSLADALADQTAVMTRMKTILKK